MEETQEQERQPSPLTDFAVRERQSSISTKRVLAIVLIVAGLGAVILGGVFLVGRGKGSSTPSPTPTVFEGPSPIPSPSPVAKTQASLKVQVLNGTGIAGEATKVAALVKKAGFEQIETGNAGNYDYTKTEIQAKSDVSSDILEKIETALSSYKPVIGNTLSSSSSYDIVIIVGGVKKPTPTPKSATPSATPR